MKKPTLKNKTVKVSTIIKSIVIFFALIGSFVAGWHSNQNYQFNVNEKASALVSQLKVNQ